MGESALHLARCRNKSLVNLLYLASVSLCAICDVDSIPLDRARTRLPQTLLGKCPITIRTRTFETVTLSFTLDQEASDVFESVKDLTVASTWT